MRIKVLPCDQKKGRSAIPARLVCFCLVPAVAGFVLQQVFAQPLDAGDPVSAWLKAQADLRTWSADFTQTRTLKSLAQPLTATGHVWFAAPNQFRWELGHPPKTIAVREPDQMLVIYPNLKRAERYALNQAGPWRDMLALLDAGFPRSRSDIESRFAILSQTVANGVCQLTLQPKRESARRLMPQITISFDTNTLVLRSTELQFADGSTMENVFGNAVSNPKIDASVFNPEIPGDYKISQPFQK